MSRRRYRRRHKGLGAIVILFGGLFFLFWPFAIQVNGQPPAWDWAIAIPWWLLVIFCWWLIKRKPKKTVPVANQNYPPQPLGEYNSRHISQDTKIAVAARDGNACRNCGSMTDLQFDHVIPWSRGGSNNAQNIQILCGRCNRRKSNKL
jgi:hypothetical protein